MNWFFKFLSSSIGKKFVMGATGLFLISFLVVHGAINACIYYNDEGATFESLAHFMGTNMIVHILEVGLFAGIFLHIIQAYVLFAQNSKKRPVKYAVNGSSKNTRWYSRSMTLLGTLILIFLIIHIRNFWIPNRLTGLESTLFNEMKETFQQLWLVIFYELAMISLAYHLMHGFQSAFQTFGIHHSKYNPLIRGFGMGFSIFVPLVFASMPLAFYFHWIQ